MNNQEELVIKEEHNSSPNKKSKKKLIIGLVITLFVLLVVVGIALAIILPKYSPKNVFKTTINEAYKSSSKELKNDFDTMYFTFSLSPEVKGSGSALLEDMISNFSIKLQGGIDYKNKTFSYNLVTNYKDKEFINADFQYDKEFYLMLNKLYNKPIKAEESDFTDAFTKADVESLKTVIEEYSKAYDESLKDEYFESDKQTITVGDKKVKSRVSILNLNKENTKEMDKYAQNRLLKNDKFLNAYAKLTSVSKEEVIKSLEEESNYEDFTDTKIKLYTGMWNKDLIKIQFVYDDMVVELEKNDENNNAWKISFKNDEITMVFNLEYTYEYNKKIDLKDVSGAVNSKDLPADALTQILTNIKNQDGYKLLDEDVKDATTMSIDQLLSLFLGSFYNSYNNTVY